MNQTRLHNQTLFVAALSVYFGLLIVGAPPQVLAQQQIIGKSNQAGITEKKLSQQNKTEEANCQNFTIAETIKFFAEGSNNFAKLKPTVYSRKNVYRDGQVIDSQILIAEGEKFIIDFFGSLNVCNSGRGNSDGFIVSGTLFDFKANQEEIVFDVTATFANAEAAKENAQFNQILFEAINNKRKTESPELIAKERLEIVVLDNTIIRYENDQVFIVTRLPRAGLESLLEADEKAN